MSRGAHIYSLGCLLALLGGFSNQAEGQLPASQTIPYLIHEVPTDWSSAISYVVIMSLEPVERVGNFVAWEVTEWRLKKVGAVSTHDTFWSEAFPSVATEDGLWWVEHAQPIAPKRGEFILPPLVSGIATAADPTDYDMEYYWEGIVAPAPLGGWPYANTSIIDYGFTQAAEPQPEGDGGGGVEPVELPPVPPGEEDPYHSSQQAY